MYAGWNSFEQSDPPKFHLPIAVPGSGKSRLASNLCISGTIVESAIVSPDQIREWLTDDMSSQEFNGQVFQIVDKVIAARMKARRDIFLDATNLTKRDRDRVLTSAAEAGYAIIVYLWDLPREVIVERNNGRTNPVPDHAMDKMFQRMDGMGLDLKNPDSISLGDFDITVEIVEKPKDIS